jgi:DNA modification methylase
VRSRVLKKSGSCFVVISDKFNNKGDKALPDGSLYCIPSRFALAMTERLGFVLKNDIIWEKPNGFPNGAAARRRFSINYEHVFFFVKDSSDYYFQTQYEPYATDPGNCPKHISLGKIWSKRKQSSAVCDICGGAFCNDHIFKINNSYYCEEHRAIDNFKKLLPSNDW